MRWSSRFVAQRDQSNGGAGGTALVLLLGLLPTLGDLRTKSGHSFYFSVKRQAFWHLELNVHFPAASFMNSISAHDPKLSYGLLQSGRRVGCLISVFRFRKPAVGQLVLPAKCGRSDPKKSSCTNGCSLIRYRTLGPVGCQTVDRPERTLAIGAACVRSEKVTGRRTGNGPE